MKKTPIEPAWSTECRDVAVTLGAPRWAPFYGTVLRAVYGLERYMAA